LYNRATTPLYRDGDDKFALEEDDMVSFLNLMSLRANTCGWEKLSTKKLLSEYGEISRDKVRARTETIARAYHRTAQEDASFKSAQNRDNLKEDD
jgi:hypothetical protein